jgi:hypothetical protein
MGATGPPGLDTQRRFWAKVVIEPVADGCWLWTAAKYSRGHGAFQVGTKAHPKTVSAHRFAYELLVDFIPEGLQVHHICEVPACVNPAHMELVTHSEHKMRHRGTHCGRGHLIVELPSGIRRCRECHAHDERGRKERRRVGL